MVGDQEGLKVGSLTEDQR